LDHCDPRMRICRSLIEPLAKSLAAMAPATEFPRGFWDGRPLSFATHLKESTQMLTPLGMSTAPPPRNISVAFFGHFATSRVVETNVIDMTYADRIGAALQLEPPSCVVVHGVSGSGKSSSMNLSAYSLAASKRIPFVIYMCSNDATTELEHQLCGLDKLTRNAKALAYVEAELLSLMPQSGATCLGTWTQNRSLPSS
jgi:hypothetical protein